jgi:hypothetical protein
MELGKQMWRSIILKITMALMLTAVALPARQL